LFPPTEQKTCSKCNATKPVTAFYQRRERGKDGRAVRYSHCSECHQTMTRLFYSQNREKYREYARARRQRKTNGGTV
jgi:hypothetical protein